MVVVGQIFFWNFESLLKYAGFDLADQQLV